LQRRGFVDRPEIDVAADIQRADAEVSRLENARVDADAFFCPVRPSAMVVASTDRSFRNTKQDPGDSER
jgi:hypothetical protein